MSEENFLHKILHAVEKDPGGWLKSILKLRQGNTRSMTNTVNRDLGDELAKEVTKHRGR